MNEITKKSILEMANGGFLEQVNYEMSKVIDNILDPNTKATGKRKITVTMEITPDDSRMNFSVRFSTKLALVPVNALTTSMHIFVERDTGEIQVVENVPQIPGQLGLNGTEQAFPLQLKIIRSA